MLGEDRTFFQILFLSFKVFFWQIDTFLKRNVVLYSLLTLSPKTMDVFMALNLSPKAAQSARGEPEMETTRRTMDLAREVSCFGKVRWVCGQLCIYTHFDLGMTARRPAEAAPASGPKLGKKVFFYKKVLFCAKKVSLLLFFLTQWSSPCLLGSCWCCRRPTSGP